MTREDFMDLKTFVAQSIIQISEGIKEAQNSSGTDVAPHVALNSNGYQQIASKEERCIPQFIEFDIAVTTFNDGQATAKTGIKVFEVINIGFNGKTDQQYSNISRIKFRIPVVW